MSNCTKCGTAIGGFLGVPAAPGNPSVCQDCMGTSNHSSSKTEDSGLITPSSVAESSGGAIAFLQGVNTVFLMIQILSAIAIIFFVPSVNGVALGFGVFLMSFVLWAIIRVIIGVAQDVKAMRANSDAQLSRHLRSEVHG